MGWMDLRGAGNRDINSMCPQLWGGSRTHASPSSPPPHLPLVVPDPSPTQAILSEHESYIDCYLRLACISRRMGATSEAHRWAVKALELQGGHADALALMSQLYMERRWGGGGEGKGGRCMPGEEKSVRSGPSWCGFVWTSF